MSKDIKTTHSKDLRLLINFLSVAITGFGSLIITNPSYAFKISLTPALPQEVEKSPNDLATFIVAITDNRDIINGYQFSLNIDGDELSNLQDQILEYNVTDKRITASSQDIATLSFRVLNPKKDGNSDVFFTSNFTINHTGQLDGQPKTTVLQTSSIKGADVVPPVPEPLTILGSAGALAWGILFKRKFNK